MSSTPHRPLAMPLSYRDLTRAAPVRFGALFPFFLFLFLPFFFFFFFGLHRFDSQLGEDSMFNKKHYLVPLCGLIVGYPLALIPNMKVTAKRH